MPGKAGSGGGGKTGPGKAGGETGSSGAAGDAGAVESTSVLRAANSEAEGAAAAVIS